MQVLIALATFLFVACSAGKEPTDSAAVSEDGTEANTDADTDTDTDADTDTRATGEWIASDTNSRDTAAMSDTGEDGVGVRECR